MNWAQTMHLQDGTTDNDKCKICQDRVHLNTKWKKNKHVEPHHDVFKGLRSGSFRSKTIRRLNAESQTRQNWSDSAGSVWNRTLTGSATQPVSSQLLTLRTHTAVFRGVFVDLWSRKTQVAAATIFTPLCAPVGTWTKPLIRSFEPLFAPQHKFLPL